MDKLDESSKVFRQIGKRALESIHSYAADGVRVDEKRLVHADLLSSPPSVSKEIEIRGPGSHRFDGRYIRFGIRPGFSVSVSDTVATETFVGTGSSDAGLSLTVMLSGAGFGWLTQPYELGQNNPVPYGAAKTFVYYASSTTIGRYHAPAGTRFLSVELKLDMSFLDQLGLLRTLEDLAPSDPMVQLSAEGIRIGTVPSSKLAIEAARSIVTLSEEPDSVVRDGRIEARALDILSDTVQMIALADRNPRKTGVKRRETDALKEIHDLLVSSPEKPWSVDELAARAGMSATRLKERFRAKYGAPVHRFLQTHRIETARHLLIEDPSRPIISVAFAVGYSNPSYFATLFQRAYRVLPSDFAATLRKASE